MWEHSNPSTVKLHFSLSRRNLLGNALASHKYLGFHECFNFLLMIRPESIVLLSHQNYFNSFLIDFLPFPLSHYQPVRCLCISQKKESPLSIHSPDPEHGLTRSAQAIFQPHLPLSKTSLCVSSLHNCTWQSCLPYPIPFSTQKSVKNGNLIISLTCFKPFQIVLNLKFKKIFKQPINQALHDLLLTYLLPFLVQFSTPPNYSSCSSSNAPVSFHSCSFSS